MATFAWDCQYFSFYSSWHFNSCSSVPVIEICDMRFHRSGPFNATTFVFYGKPGQREEKVKNEAETVLKGESYNTAILACGKN